MSTKKYIIDNKADQTITGNLSISGSQSISGDLSILGSESISGDLTVSGSQSISGNLTVSGVINGTIGMSYSTYRALLTQTGEIVGGYIGDFGDSLILGETYTITNYANGDDFSNMVNVISGTANETGFTFIATESLPLYWDEGSILTSNGGIVVNVLENTLGHDIMWDWAPFGGGGYYFVTSTGVFDLIIGEAPTAFPREKTTYNCGVKYGFDQYGLPVIPIIGILNLLRW